jgi:hypothetical protein
LADNHERKPPFIVPESDERAYHGRSAAIADNAFDGAPVIGRLRKIRDKYQGKDKYPPE